MRQPDTIDIGSVIETQASSWYSHLVVILCCVAVVIEGYDAQVLAYAAPAIIRDWNIEQSYFGPVFGAALFGYMLGAGSCMLAYPANLDYHFASVAIPAFANPPIS
jgi:MFS family permease